MGEGEGGREGGDKTLSKFLEKHISLTLTLVRYVFIFHGEGGKLRLKDTDYTFRI